MRPAKTKETERTLTCDRCGAVVSPTGRPENHVCIPKPAPSPAERCATWHNDGPCPACGRASTPPEAASEVPFDRETFCAFINGLSCVQPDWTAALLAHDAALRAEVERLKVCVRGHHGPEAHDHE